VWLLQLLAKKHTRGKVVSYRVNMTCRAYTDEREFATGGSQISSLWLDLPMHSSCTIGLDAATERGYNNSLQPASVVIPDRHDGQSMQWHCQSSFASLTLTYLLSQSVSEISQSN